ncbi:MAG: flagellar motor switch protein FliM [Anaerolineaceae bacterium]|nr:flagellar motor switch protein FliM [Anaerolineaceae bacterium]
MPQILDQNEIDALLSAVDEGALGGEAEAAMAPGRPAVATRDAPTPPRMQPYDFKRPERVSKEQMRSLESLHETFSRNFGAGLSAHLRTIVEVSIISIEQMTYSEFLQLLPNPTCLQVLGCQPLEGSMILEINPLIIFPIIDRLLGGGNEAAFIPDRALTGIETTLVRCIIERATGTLREAWMPVAEIDFQAVRSESNPAMVQIVPPNEVVVVMGFEIATGGRSGMMSLCIPFNVIEPIMSEFSGHNWSVYNRSNKDQSSKQCLATRIGGTVVELTAYLAETTISLSELMQLKPGDVLKTDKPANGDLQITVNGQAKFRGKPGVYKGHKALGLTRFALPQERI